MRLGRPPTYRECALSRRFAPRASRRRADPFAELDEVPVPVEDGELSEPPRLLGERAVGMHDACRCHLFIEAVDAKDIDAA